VPVVIGFADLALGDLFGFWVVIGGRWFLSTGTEGQSSPKPRTDGHAAVPTSSASVVSWGVTAANGCGSAGLDEKGTPYHRPPRLGPLPFAISVV